MAQESALALLYLHQAIRRGSRDPGTWRGVAIVAFGTAPSSRIGRNNGSGTQ